MDVGESPLPNCINPNNFPAKLWRLLNNPANRAIHWDSLGEVIVIDKRLFESQILSPSTVTSDNPDAFKTSNFSSFVRQLNLYGFRKADPAVKHSRQSTGVGGPYHYFFNPNFKRNHPELVANLKRLTVDNKAKLEAGLNISCRPPSRHQRLSVGDDDREKHEKRVKCAFGASMGSSSLLSSTHLEPTHPYYPNKAQAMTAHNGTPVPPRYLIRAHGTALSPTVFTADKRTPVSLNQHYAGAASSSSAVHLQQGLMANANQGNPNSTTINSPNAQYQPGYYSPVCQCYQPNLEASHMTGSGLQTGSFSPPIYYQASYPVSMLCCGDHNQKNRENQEGKKCDINLDTVFQLADEVMQTPSNSFLVRVVTPEKPGPVSVPSSSTCSTKLCDHPGSGSSMKANSLSAAPVILAVGGSADLATYEQQGESVVSVPEQMPEDAICEVTSDEAEHTEIIGVEVSDPLRDTSQTYSSSCTGSTHDI